MRVGGNHAGVEIMLLTITSGASFVEVPVNYLPRVGVSSVTGSRRRALDVGLRMILQILRFRLTTRRPAGAAGRRPRAMSGSHFDAIAGAYDESLPAHVVEHYLRKRTRFVRRALPAGAGLDVGCGTGLLAARLAAAGFAMTRLRPLRGMLDVLRRAARRSSYRDASGTALPFARRHLRPRPVRRGHAPHRRPAACGATLAEMVRVARPGGRVLVWDHNPRNPYWRLLMARVPQDTGEERLIGARELIGGLRAAGAEIVLSTQLGWVPDFVPARAIAAAAAVERAIERVPLVRRLGAHNVILATKPALA